MDQAIGILGQAVLVLTALVILCLLFLAFLHLSRAIVRFLKEMSRV
jgi:small neutral amino acid transporter SnatA (MarC family)